MSFFFAATMSLSCCNKHLVMYCVYQTIIKNAAKNDRILRSQVLKEYQRKKDLSEIIDILSNKQEESLESNCLSKTESESEVPNASNEQHVYLQPIDTNCCAVYQSIKSSDAPVDTMDLMKTQVNKCYTDIALFKKKFFI